MSTIIEQANLFSQYENSRMESYLSYGARKRNVIPYDSLSETSSCGIPIATFRDQNGKLQVIFTEDTHSLIIGATRSGKTTGFVIPMIKLKSLQKEKASMIISDPKGELCQQCAADLKRRGYLVKVIDFRNYNNSECWNPLTSIYRKNQEAFHLQDKVRVLKKEEGYVAEYNGKIYYSVESLDNAIERDKKMILYDVENAVDLFCLNVITTERTDDPYWEDTARLWLKAHIFAMLEDSVPETAGERTLITEETFSIRTLLTINNSFHFGTGQSADTSGDDGYFSSRPIWSKARSCAYTSVIQNGGTTRACVLSSFNTKMAPYKEVSANLITSCNSFELEQLVDGKQPVALFVIYRDEIRSSYSVIRNFITSAYSFLIETANKSPNLRLDRPFYFLLDEFGNFPAIRDFDTTISACGGRNIWFQIVLQSYSQLVNQYNEDTAEIIKENLNLHIFFGTNNAATKIAFSKECGKKTIVSPKSVFSGENPSIGSVTLEEVSVLPVSDLDYMEVGECYVTSSNSEAVLHSHMERSYLCQEYKSDTNDEPYVADVDPLDDRFIYVRLVMERDDDDDDFLFGRRNRTSVKRSRAEMPKPIEVGESFRRYIEKQTQFNPFQVMADQKLSYQIVKDKLKAMEKEGYISYKAPIYTVIKRRMTKAEKTQAENKIKAILSDLNFSETMYLDTGLENTTIEAFLQNCSRSREFSRFAKHFADLGLLKKDASGVHFLLSPEELDIFKEFLGDPNFAVPKAEEPPASKKRKNKGNPFDPTQSNGKRNYIQEMLNGFYKDKQDEDDDDDDDVRYSHRNHDDDDDDDDDDTFDDLFDEYFDEDEEEGDDDDDDGDDD